MTDRGLTDVNAVEAGFLTYNPDGPPADLVHSRFALHHLPDFWKSIAIERPRDVLLPGGIFRLIDIAYDADMSYKGDSM